MERALQPGTSRDVKSAFAAALAAVKSPPFLTWLVMSDGMGDGGLERVLASCETNPESWEETLLSRWAPAEGIWSRLLEEHHKDEEGS